MARYIKITLNVTEANAGTLIAEILTNRCRIISIDVENERPKGDVLGEILTTLKNGPLTKAFIAQASELSAFAVAGRMEKLKAKKLVTKIGSGAGSHVMWALTAAGKKYLADLAKASPQNATEEEGDTK